MMSLKTYPLHAPGATVIKLSAVRPERRCAAPKSKGEIIKVSSFDSSPSLRSGPTLRTNGKLLRIAHDHP